MARSPDVSCGSAARRRGIEIVASRLPGLPGACLQVVLGRVQRRLVRRRVRLPDRRAAVARAAGRYGARTPRRPWLGRRGRSRRRRVAPATPTRPPATPRGLRRARATTSGWPTIASRSTLSSSWSRVITGASDPIESQVAARCTNRAACARFLAACQAVLSHSLDPSAAPSVVSDENRCADKRRRKPPGQRARHDGGPRPNTRRAGRSRGPRRRRPRRSCRSSWRPARWW